MPGSGGESTPMLGPVVSDEDSAKTASGTLALAASQKSAGSLADKLTLEVDCYSIVLVLPGPLWFIPAVLLPGFAAFFQITFLVFVSIDHTNVFQEGRWLQPSSAHWYVYLLKGLSALVTILKCYGELQSNMTFYVALQYGKIERSISSARWCLGWFWLVTQYVVTIVVLVCAISLVGSAQSAINCIFKSLAVALVVDLDNMLAKAIETMMNVEFKIDADPTLQPPPTQYEQRNKLFEGKFLRWVFYMGFPIAIAFSEVSLAVYHNSLPLTFLRMRGFVSNEFAPELRSDIAGGCCSPMLAPDADNDASTTNYTVLVFSRVEQPAREQPIVHWVALEAQPEPTPPSSYQVMLGQDGDGNPGHDHGFVQSEDVQAKYWLTAHGFGEDTYDALVKDVGLHQRVSPYAAILQVRDLKSYGHAYRIYVAAQNGMTLALSPEPLGSAPLITSVCPLHCEICETSLTCNACTEGYFLLRHQRDDDEGRAHTSCTKCIEHCADCSKQAAALLEHSVEDDVMKEYASGVPCDAGQCSEGYGMSNHSECVRCSVSSCATCEVNGTALPGTCNTCQVGYGLHVNRTNGTEYTCDACQDKCLSCNQSIGCVECDMGFGLHGEHDNRTCVECQEGCVDCQNSTTCSVCKDAFVITNGECEECPESCKNCTIGGATACDECHRGYGLYSGSCSECDVDHCVRCDNVDTSYHCTQCKQNFGLNHDNTSCARCGAFCTQCDRSGECAACEDGYAVEDVEVEGEDGTRRTNLCRPCGDGCQSCSKVGAGRCDACLPGFHKNGSLCHSTNEKAFLMPNLEV